MSFYITLPSNVKSNNPNNTIGEYVTTLAKKLKLDGSYEVGLFQISYTKSWYNVLNLHKSRLYDEMGNKYSENDLIIINPGYYSSVHKLTQHINEKLKLYPSIKPPMLSYNEIDNKVNLKAGLIDETIVVYPDLGGEIEDMLGLLKRDVSKLYYKSDSDNNFEAIVFNDADSFRERVIKPFYPVEISGGYHSLFVYCDILEPTLVGDTCAQLLSVVEIPHRSEFGEQCVIRYENPQYHKVLTEEFQNILISIKDDFGSVVPFKFGRVIITLHFRKV